MSTPAPDAPDTLLANLQRLRHRSPFRFPAESIPAEFRRAAVLIPFWVEDGAVRVLLTRRAEHMSRNPGEVAFAGGLLEPGETWEQAALRDAREEVGLDSAIVEPLGQLDDAWSGSGSHLVSVVAWLSRPPRLVASRAEVAEILVAEVSDLLRPQARSHEEVVHRGVRYVNHSVQLPGAEAYGLSADLLLEALGWATGAQPKRGPERLAELESYFSNEQE